ncbi:DUF4418 family protein [Treponema sp.]|uniref:DUF4418 family protein n=1 Tax=Treponema sp. TaxID=166 RepID=UPI00388EFA1B
MKKISVSDVILLILSLILTFGSHFAFHACSPKPDGSWMVCHWAERVITALGIVFTVLSASRFFFEPETKSGISLSILTLSVVTAFIPGIIVNLCLMKEMHCHTVMRPAVIVISILIALISLVDFILSHLKQHNQKDNK